MIKGLRNRIVHDYEGINLRSIWVVLQSDIRQLKIDLQSIMQEQKNEKNKE